MNKPTLFHDIDGVLYGVYDEEFQLRPGIKPWLKWAHENFDVVSPSFGSVFGGKRTCVN
jgi:hypothetical protein